MKEYEVRNLKLAIIDDDIGKRLHVPGGLVDLVEFLPSGGSQVRLSRLEQHCRNALRAKIVRFDLCSIDMNFQEDFDDPVRPRPVATDVDHRPASTEIAEPELLVADPAIMTASGLYHGLALLARRDPLDDARNVMPLAWEVRSAAPSAFLGQALLRNDALRGFALLRSLLGQPRDDESLEACIWREHREAHPADDAAADDSARDRHWLEVLEADLRGQHPSSGNVHEVLIKLLPRWRSLFLAAVRRRDVLIDVPELERQVRQLAQLGSAGRPPDLVINPPSPICIPLSGYSQDDAAMAIRLTSAMADLVAGGRIDVRGKMDTLDAGDGALSVLEWCQELLRAAMSKESLKTKFREIWREFGKAIIAGGPHAVAELWARKQGTHKEDNRFLIYILMRARLWMTEEGRRRDPNDKGAGKTLAVLYGWSKVNDHTFAAPARKNRIHSMETKDLRSGLCDALRERKGALVRARLWDDWLAAGVREFALAPAGEGGLGLSDGTVERKAPGLKR